MILAPNWVKLPLDTGQQFPKHNTIAYFNNSPILVNAHVFRTLTRKFVSSPKQDNPDDIIRVILQLSC